MIFADMKLPRENDDYVQDLLKDSDMPLYKKAQLIYGHDNACLSREHDRRKPKPDKSVAVIHNILIERER